MSLDYFGNEFAGEQSEQQEKEKQKDQEKEIERLNEELLDIRREEEWLDDMISTVNNQLHDMSKDELYEQFAYVTYDDIKKLNRLTEHKDSTLIAIRAPPNTKLEVPDLEEKDGKKDEEIKENLPQREGNEKEMDPPNPVVKTPKERGIQTNDKKRYQIMLNSGGEEIMVYLISNNDDKSDEDQPDDGDEADIGEGEEDKDSFLNFDPQIQNIDSQLEPDRGQQKGSSKKSKSGSNNKPNQGTYTTPDELDNIFSVSNMFNTGE